MSSRDPHVFHTLDEEWLASYAAGGLSPAKRLVIACQAALKPALSQRLSRLDHVGGALLEGAEGEALSDGFMSGVLAALDGDDDAVSAAAGEPGDRAPSEAPGWMPGPLGAFLSDAGAPIRWRAAGPGISRAPLLEGEDGERLYLLRARPGLRIPSHGHPGEEWTLVLQGGYHVGADGYVAGDLHREDETCTHQILIDDDGPCISLVAVEGKLRFGNPLLRALQPFFGV